MAGLFSAAVMSLLPSPRLGVKRWANERTRIRELVHWVGNQIEEPQKPLVVLIRVEAPQLQPLHADTGYHVYMVWEMGHIRQEDGICRRVERRVHLTGNAGNYAYFADDIRAAGNISAEHHFIIFGTFTPEQRQRILWLAENVDFSPRWTVNTCRTWMWRLLTSMVAHGLISDE
ncbi:hypothetical protein DACRYDRAFT_109019 [Dacryopinax primogenitus]|uniref:Uncharacterized protein n=1 Tax=Dacryopinax primogenitus (strain DJM 731) TaxID=1858805 RepID=M5FX33_DACPD|nr:uncharacterized protein DACRYDRAFT_109019 [Dacryopinax primogenitus]EJU00280.1 hypothetical protein DACRYDRAFT_109019 [Dacryopinax primogenitus]